MENFEMKLGNKYIVNGNEVTLIDSSFPQEFVKISDTTIIKAFYQDEQREEIIFLESCGKYCHDQNTKNEICLLFKDETEGDNNYILMSNKRALTDVKEIAVPENYTDKKEKSDRMYIVILDSNDNVRILNSKEETLPKYDKEVIKYYLEKN